MLRLLRVMTVALFWVVVSFGPMIGVVWIVVHFARKWW
jgi:hypothetical protein